MNKQTSNRAEKTEILSEEEQGLERRVELIRNISSALLKKLLLCLRSSPQAADLDRRMVSVVDVVRCHQVSFGVIGCHLMLFGGV